MSDSCDSATGATCPAVVETLTGDFLAVGSFRAPNEAKLLTTEKINVGFDEAAVVIPREVMLKFLGDFSEKVLKERIAEATPGVRARLAEKVKTDGERLLGEVEADMANPHPHSRWVTRREVGE
jgi:hypothetical protein